jgi:hypothetical protein
LPEEADDDQGLLHNQFQDSPDVPHGHEEFPLPHSAMDVDPAPPPDLPVNLLQAAVESRSQKVHQSGSSSLTRVFKGRALTSVAHSVANVDTKSGCLDDEEVDSPCDADSLSGDSGDESPDGGSLAMDVDDDAHPEELRVRVRAWGIHVDPTFNLTICLDCGIAIPWDLARSHRNRQHKPTGTSGTSLPFKNIFANTLCRLQAHQPKPLPAGPIPPIDGLRIIPNMVKCITEGCASQTLFTSRKPFHKHCLQSHGKLPLSRRLHTITVGHQIGLMKNSTIYIEVAASKIADSSALGAVLTQVDQCGLYSRDTKYQPAVNKRPRGPLLAQTNWEQCIENVDLKSLRQTALKHEGEPGFQLLVLHSQKYYKFIAENLSRLSTLTLRAIASTSPSGDTEKAPFRRPQEDPTLERYASFMARFIIFLIRHLCQPVDNFDVPLHPKQSHCLRELYDELLSASNNSSPHTDQHCVELIHRTVFSLLSCVSDEFLKNEMKDLFTLFLLTYHLTDDYGNTSRASQVPPTISQAQWCFRATAAYEIMLQMPYYDNNSFK